MHLPALTLVTLSTLASLVTSTPTNNGLPVAGIIPAIVPAKPATVPAAAKPATVPAAAKPATLPAVVKPIALPVPAKPATGNTPPHASSDEAASTPVTGTTSSPYILTYLRTTLTEVRKHTLNINNSVASVNRLDLSFVTKRASSIIVVREEVRIICLSITQLNTASISRWTDSIGDVGSVRAQLSAAVQELVWEIVFTLRGAMAKLQCSIWDLLGSEVLVLLATFGQLFCILNVWIDGFLKLSLGLLNAQIGILTSVFSGVLAYVVDVAGGLFAQVTKLLACLLS